MEVAVQFSWRDVGPVNVDYDRLLFPVVPEVPGIYRFMLDDGVYFGETDRLKRRFQHYRTPGPSQSTNIRLNAKMRELVEAGGSVEVSIITDAELAVESIRQPLDLGHKAGRLLIESAAITAGRLAGLTLLNL